MKKHLWIFALATAVTTLSSCKKEGWPYCIRANGDLTKETRLVESFNRVEMDMSGDVFLIQDSSVSTPIVEIEASENIMERIETKVRNNTLSIGEDRCINREGTIRIHITVSDLEEVSLNGSGNISSVTPFGVNSIALHINGSGNIYFKAAADEVKTSINGSGDIDIDGTTENFDVSISGSGNVEAFDLSSADCYVSINGSGNCEVNASHSLEVEISGSGDVIYTGSPEIFIVNNNGSGSVRPR